ncbi:sarcalumenin [Galendromus occidentalis]|uniref:Sarcalumenin n=1 Tax=Galendromus occidentalis TaxID=34638 RepID=A0AAJ7SH02_9ACAR|nr:sarcalumenin [Galendromus occidentalis]
MSSRRRSSLVAVHADKGKQEGSVPLSGILILLMVVAGIAAVWINEFTISAEDLGPTTLYRTGKARKAGGRKLHQFLCVGATSLRDCECDKVVSDALHDYVEKHTIRDDDSEEEIRAKKPKGTKITKTPKVPEPKKSAFDDPVPVVKKVEKREIREEPPKIDKEPPVAKRPAKEANKQAAPQPAAPTKPSKASVPAPVPPRVVQKKAPKPEIVESEEEESDSGIEDSAEELADSEEDDGTTEDQSEEEDETAEDESGEAAGSDEGSKESGGDDETSEEDSAHATLEVASTEEEDSVGSAAASEESTEEDDADLIETFAEDSSDEASEEPDDYDDQDDDTSVEESAEEDDSGIPGEESESGEAGEISESIDESKEDASDETGEVSAEASPGGLGVEESDEKSTEEPEGSDRESDEDVTDEDSEEDSEGASQEAESEEESASEDTSAESSEEGKNSDEDESGEGEYTTESSGTEEASAVDDDSDASDESGSDASEEDKSAEVGDEDTGVSVEENGSEEDDESEEGDSSGEASSEATEEDEEDESSEEDASSEEEDSEEESEEQDSGIEGSDEEASEEEGSEETEDESEEASEESEQDETAEESEESEPDESAESSEEEQEPEPVVITKPKKGSKQPKEAPIPKVVLDGVRDRSHIAEALGFSKIGTQDDVKEEKLIQQILKDIKKAATDSIKPLEKDFKFSDISQRVLGDAEIFNKPMALFLGPWSSGKSTAINYLLGTHGTRAALKTGPQPTDSFFTVLHHNEEGIVRESGLQMAGDSSFSGVNKFGSAFLSHFRGIGLNHPLLKKVMIVDTPGIIDGRRFKDFPLHDVFQWFIDRADAIYVMFDPSKLEIGLDMKTLLDQLRGREEQTRFLLNKGDLVEASDVMRVTGQLLWNVAPLFGSSDAPIIYTVSMISRPYLPGSPMEYFQDQEEEFLRHLREVMEERVENTITYARRHAVRVRNHAKLVDCYLEAYYKNKGMFGNKKKVAEQIIKDPAKYSIFDTISQSKNISKYDLLEPEDYAAFFKLNPLPEFSRLKDLCGYVKGCPIDKLDRVIAYNLPQLLKKYQEKSSVFHDSEEDKDQSRAQVKVPTKSKSKGKSKSR